MDVLSIFDEKQVAKLKDDFVAQFNNLCSTEKRYCWENNTPRVMDPNLHSEVMLLLAKCGNAYHVEALKRFVLRDFTVPTWADIEQRANREMTAALT